MNDEIATALADLVDAVEGQGVKDALESVGAGLADIVETLEGRTLEPQLAAIAEAIREAQAGSQPIDFSPIKDTLHDIVATNNEASRRLSDLIERLADIKPTREWKMKIDYDEFDRATTITATAQG